VRGLAFGKVEEQRFDGFEMQEMPRSMEFEEWIPALSWGPNLSAWQGEAYCLQLLGWY
jgi:hypothetical protein